tara:strand:+ start:230 stop:472 length:243 start_codon:yes stop_codon:yes gene_type:complete
MKEGTYYSKNRDKILEKERIKRNNLNWEEVLKKKEYNRNYYLDILKEKRKTYKPQLDSTVKYKKDYNLNFKQGSFIINFN